MRIARHSTPVQSVREPGLGIRPGVATDQNLIRQRAAGLVAGQQTPIGTALFGKMTSPMIRCLAQRAMNPFLPGKPPSIWRCPCRRFADMFGQANSCPATRWGVTRCFLCRPCVRSSVVAVRASNGFSSEKCTSIIGECLTNLGCVSGKSDRLPGGSNRPLSNNFCCLRGAGTVYCTCWRIWSGFWVFRVVTRPAIAA